MKIKKLHVSLVGEALGLFFFMFNAGVATTVLEHPSSLVRIAIEDDLVRRFILGGWMALVIYVIIKNPFGEVSGAHINPAMTVAFWKNGNISSAIAGLYLFMQFSAGIFSAWFNRWAIGFAFEDMPVNFAATVPGPLGVFPAFAAEFLMTAVLMIIILVLSHSSRHKDKAGIVIAILLAAYLVVETPLSGMSLNPARSFGPALIGGVWKGLWIYFVAPVLGALSAQVTYKFLLRKGMFQSHTGNSLIDRFNRYFQKDEFPKFPKEN